MENHKNCKVAHRLGRNIWVCTEFGIHVLWGRDGGDEVEHVFDNIAPAIRQHKHVLEQRYLGVEARIRGQLLVIPGETQKMDALVHETMDIARRFLRPDPLTDQRRENLRKRIERLIVQIGAVRNAHKVKLRRGLEFAHLQTSADLLINVGQESDAQIAAGMYDAAQAGLARLEDIARKVWGTGIRFQNLIREERRVKGIIRTTYNTLGGFLLEFQKQGDLPQRDLKRIANRVCKGKTNLVKDLEGIWIPPYGLRVRSREVQRLKKVGEYAAEGNIGGMEEAIKGAFLKLQPVVEEERDRWRPKAERWIDR